MPLGPIQVVGGDQPDFGRAAADGEADVLHAAFAPAERPVTVVETHMSWLFLGRTFVLKLKKPVRLPYLDFTTLESRRRNCHAELRLNRRLAPEIYRRIVPLRCDPAGRLTTADSGRIVDWLVEMDRLPAHQMLKARIGAGTLEPGDVGAIALRLARFYAAAKPEIRDGGAYLTHLEVESAVSREVLLRPSLGFASATTEFELDAVDRLLEHWTPAIEARIAAAAQQYEPVDLVPGRTYDVQSIVAPVFGPDGGVQLVLRVCRLPQQAEATDVLGWIDALTGAARRLSATEGLAHLVPHRGTMPA